jgi:hypothetical protein
MRKDERDVSEILKFDLFEETVGSWLRSIIKRLEEERTAISTESLADRSPHGTERTSLKIPQLGETQSDRQRVMVGSGH